MCGPIPPESGDNTLSADKCLQQAIAVSDAIFTAAGRGQRALVRHLLDRLRKLNGRYEWLCWRRRERPSH